MLDADVLDKILDLGYRYTLVDQNTHLWHWLGRTTSLGDGGYRINRINGVNCFVINDGASTYRFSNDDNGLTDGAARAVQPQGAQRHAGPGGDAAEQLGGLRQRWPTPTRTTANVRWLANHPWIEIVSLEDIARGQVD